VAQDARSSSPERAALHGSECSAPQRQRRRATLSGSLILFKPSVAYRLRRSQSTDPPLPPEVPAARNPPDGAAIDYWLPADASGPVTLEILTRAGASVRRYSSADAPPPYDEKAFNVPMYWARPPHALLAANGMHRFVWDL